MPSTLITANEAEEIINPSPISAYRTPLMITVGVIVVIVATLLIMLLLSLRGAKTGFEGLFPFLQKNEIKSLQLPGS